MPQVETFRVSSSGQMSLPAAVRRRWDLERGGQVDVVDLGFGVLTVPAGTAVASSMRSCPPSSIYAAVTAEVDRDLITE